MKKYKVVYMMWPESKNIEIIIFAKSYEDACVYAKNYRKESFTINCLDDERDDYQV